MCAHVAVLLGMGGIVHCDNDHAPVVGREGGRRRRVMIVMIMMIEPDLLTKGVSLPLISLYLPTYLLTYDPPARANESIDIHPE